MPLFQSVFWLSSIPGKTDCLGRSAFVYLPISWWSWVVWASHQILRLFGVNALGSGLLSPAYVTQTRHGNSGNFGR